MWIAVWDVWMSLSGLHSLIIRLGVGLRWGANESLVFALGEIDA